MFVNRTLSPDLLKITGKPISVNELAKEND